MRNVYLAKINEFIKKTSNINKNILFIFKGFANDLLEKIESINNIAPIKSNNLKSLYENKENIFKEFLSDLVVTSNNFRKYKCSYEEFLLLNYSAISTFCECIVITNNIYDKKYPVNYEIDNIDSLVKYFENEEYGDEIAEENSLFFNYYGEIIKTSNNYYISYKENADIKEIELFNPEIKEIQKSEISIYDESIIELSENEEDFLNLIEYILLKNGNCGLVKVSTYSNIELFFERYKKRMLILQELFNENLKFEIVFKKSEVKYVEDKEYKKILKKYWGYDDFRKIKNYKTINYELSKEIIEISQAQIIDDIINQAENSLNKKDFKDIFVTAPTGSGKSVMFQIPAIYLSEKYNLMTIVVSPLIGLMFDQVKGLERKAVNISATINSNVTPIEKSTILEKIRNNEISILYISPETLLSRSDINMLIGERKLGLVVIDEAHIVTTWGKAFRSDYWYLGTYLNKLRKERDFPVATFTATAIYAGYEDMYKETKESLYMKNPISHFGYIKRDNINIKIKKLETETSFKEYRNMKYKILTKRLEYYYSKNQKTLIYFPTIALINDFYIFAQNNTKKEIVDNISKYYGPLDKLEKQESYEKFLSGEKIFILATKAFGMGIDVSDIHNIYHFAPTGNVCDYVQEVGRVARGLEEGDAYFDFLPQDFVHVRRLHGLSTIRKNQLVQIVKKVLEIMDINKNKQRHFVIDPSSFAYIFRNKNDAEIDIDEISNKLKIGLLLIEKDFYQKLSFPPIIARPQNIFSYEYFKFNKDYEDKIVKEYEKYIKIIDKYNDENIYSFNLKKIWEEKYLKYTFPMFKYMLHSRNNELNIELIDHFIAMLKIEVNLKDTIYAVKERYNTLIDSFSEILDDLYIKKSFFDENDIISRFPRKYFKSDFIRGEFINVMIMVAGSYDRMEKEKNNYYQNFLKWDENKDKYKVYNNNYTEFIKWCKKKFNYISNDIKLEGQYFEKYYPKYYKDTLKEVFYILGMLESGDLITYIVKGGDEPQVFIRVNSRYQLEKIISNPKSYYNQVLSNVYTRYKLSVEMLTYLFKKQVGTDEFWDYIEDYFFGKIPEEVEMEVFNKKKD